ncbi:hypothetical protein BV20DRAFT_334614 [Pilatotrama ljubarskyi]|nr:hypothetical protein BV20DRAFT_334614 [Pilatotrama ljubarskyi]
MKTIHSSLIPPLGSSPGELRIAPPNRACVIFYDGGTLALEFWPLGWQDTCLRLQLEDLPYIGSDFDSALTGFVDLFARKSGIEELDFMGDSADVKFETFLLLLAQLSMLQKLRFFGDGPCTPYLRALMYTSVRILIEGSDEDLHEGDDDAIIPPLCPKLKDIHLCTRDAYEEGAMEVLLSMLYRRAYYKLPKMEYVGLFYAAGWKEERLRHDAKLLSGGA